MGLQDLTTYSIEPDPLVYTTVTSTRSTFAALPRNVDEYVYKDFGAAYFDGDFEHLITVYFDAATATNSRVAVWGIANTLDDTKGIIDAGGDELYVWLLRIDGPIYQIVLRETIAGVNYADTYNCSLDTPYYLRIKRDEAVGDYGTLYCDIYTSEADRTNEENAAANLSLTLHEKEDFRYLYVTQSHNAGQADTCSGYSENLVVPITYDESLTDGLVLGDTLATQLDAQNSLTDGITLGDTPAAQATFQSSLTDGIVLGDTPAMSLTIDKSLTDGIKLGDAPSANLTVPVSLSDGITLGDSISVFRTIYVTLTDGITLGDLSEPLHWAWRRLQTFVGMVRQTFAGLTRNTFSGRTRGTFGGRTRQDSDFREREP